MALRWFSFYAIMDGWAGSLDGVGTYRSAIGENPDGMGPSTSWYAEGKGALFTVQPTRSVWRRVPGRPRVHERQGPFCCLSVPHYVVLRRRLAAGGTVKQLWVYLGQSYSTSIFFESFP